MDKEEQELVEAFRNMSDESRVMLLRQTRFALAAEHGAKSSAYPKPGAVFEPDYPAEAKPAVRTNA